MRAVFCQHPLDPKAVDPDWSAEARSAREAGFSVSRIDFEALEAGGAPGAVRSVASASEPEAAVYRGWMMEPERYAALFEALLARGVRLLNDPAQYRACHWFPESYRLVEGRTARSAWVAREEFSPEDLGAAFRAMETFGSGPALVKDYAKSQKHYWREACFIPDASDRDAAAKVVRRFLELQGPGLSGGLVFREFLEFERAAPREEGGFPPAREFRLFFADGELVDCSPHADAMPGDIGEPPPPDEFAGLAATIPSRFFALDAAKLAGGGWVVVELGDGQVSGFPPGADAGAIFRGLARIASP